MLDGNLKQLLELRRTLGARIKVSCNTFINGSPHALVVCVDLGTYRPIPRHIARQSPAHRINTECEKLIEHRIHRRQVKMAATQQIPVKCFQMTKIENDSMSLGNGS